MLSYILASPTHIYNLTFPDSSKRDRSGISDNIESTKKREAGLSHLDKYIIMQSMDLFGEEKLHGKTLECHIANYLFNKYREQCGKGLIRIALAMRYWDDEGLRRYAELSRRPILFGDFEAENTTNGSGLEITQNRDLIGSNYDKFTKTLKILNKHFFKCCKIPYEDLYMGIPDDEGDLERLRSEEATILKKYPKCCHKRYGLKTHVHLWHYQEKSIIDLIFDQISM